MPYHIGERGSNGCSGYPVVKDSTGEVMGCHKTEGDAQAQLAALHINEPDASKSDSSVQPANPSYSPLTTFPGVGVKYPEVSPRGSKRPRNRRRRINVNPYSPSDSGAGTISSGGTGGSIGSKSDDIWTGSAFSKRRKQ